MTMSSWAFLVVHDVLGKFSHHRIGRHVPQVLHEHHRGLLGDVAQPERPHVAGEELPEVAVVGVHGNVVGGRRGCRGSP